MTETSGPVAPSIGMNKAYAGGGATILAGAVAKVVIRLINVRWPTFLDPSTEDAIDVIITGAIAFMAVYYTPHGGN